MHVCCFGRSSFGSHMCFQDLLIAFYLQIASLTASYRFFLNEAVDTSCPQDSRVILGLKKLFFSSLAKAVLFSHKLMSPPFVATQTAADQSFPVLHYLSLLSSVH